MPQNRHAERAIARLIPLARPPSFVSLPLAHVAFLGRTMLTYLVLVERGKSREYLQSIQQ
jgi:hypothetical protein